MRRIIERVVTVVTTTTWKISWEDDPLHAQPMADPIPDELSDPEVLSEITAPHPAITETKEAALPKKENVRDQD